MKTSLRQKLADKIISAAPPGSAFDQLLDEAVALYREASTTLRFPDSRNEKLSAKQYLADALAFAKTTVPKLAALEKRLAPIPAQTIPWVCAFRDGCRAAVRAVRVDKGAALCCPTTGLHADRGAGWPPRGLHRCAGGSQPPQHHPGRVVSPRSVAGHTRRARGLRRDR